MSRIVYIYCDAKRCETSPATPLTAERAGWTLGAEDICPTCSSGRCQGTLGRRPEWMSPDQWDGCRCLLEVGHDGPCECIHVVADRDAALT
jgi:hypothetical protein